MVPSRGAGLFLQDQTPAVNHKKSNANVRIVFRNSLIFCILRILCFEISKFSTRSLLACDESGFALTRSKEKTWKLRGGSGPAAKMMLTAGFGLWGLLLFMKELMVT